MNIHTFNFTEKHLFIFLLVLFTFLSNFIAQFLYSLISSGSNSMINLRGNPIFVRQRVWNILVSLEITYLTFDDFIFPIYRMQWAVQIKCLPPLVCLKLHKCSDFQPNCLTNINNIVQTLTEVPWSYARIHKMTQTNQLHCRLNLINDNTSERKNKPNGIICANKPDVLKDRSLMEHHPRRSDLRLTSRWLLT